MNGAAGRLVESLGYRYENTIIIIEVARALDAIRSADHPRISRAARAFTSVCRATNPGRIDGFSANGCPLIDGLSPGRKPADHRTISPAGAHWQRCHYPMDVPDHGTKHRMPAIARRYAPGNENIAGRFMRGRCLSRAAINSTRFSFVSSPLSGSRRYARKAKQYPSGSICGVRPTRVSLFAARVCANTVESRPFTRFRDVDSAVFGVVSRRKKTLSESIRQMVRHPVYPQ